MQRGLGSWDVLRPRIGSQDGKIGSKDGCNNHGEVSNQDDKRSIEILNYRLEDWDATNKHGYGGVTMAAFRALL